jgi:hypothetical protein
VQIQKKTFSIQGTVFFLSLTTKHNQYMRIDTGTLTGSNNFQLKVEPPYTSLDIMKQIEFLHKIPFKRQHIIYESARFQRDTTLIDLDIFELAQAWLSVFLNINGDLIVVANPTNPIHEKLKYILSIQEVEFGRLSQQIHYSFMFN